MGLDPPMLDAKCLAILVTLEANLDLPNPEDEAQTNQVAQFLDEDLEVQRILANGGNNPSWAIDPAIDQWLVNRLTVYRAFVV